MGTNLIIADRYAKALFEQALEKDVIDGTLKELLKIKDLVDSDDSLRRAFFSPTVSRQALMNVLSALSQQLKTSKLTTAFLGVLAKNRRITALHDIIRLFTVKVREQKGLTIVDVWAAKELSAPKQKKLITALEKSLGKKIEANIMIDPTLIGGLKLKMGSTLIDQSVKGQLNKLHLALKGE